MRDGWQEETWDPHGTQGAVAAPPAPPLPRLALAGDPGQPPAYQLGEELGRGAASVVRAAWQPALDRTVAVKALRPEVHADEAAEALVQEARIVGRLDHPGITPVHALGVDAGGRPLLVMKRLTGLSWRALLQQPEHAVWTRFTGDRVARQVQVALRVADALSAAHRVGILHRDIKPANVVLGELGEVTLVDWGLAIRLDPAGQAQAQAAGTPGFMPPEMFRGDATLDVRSDVYLLAGTLLAALTGAPPRTGANLDALAHAAERCDVSLPDAVPPTLAPTLRRALARDPADRFASVEELRAALVAFLNHRGALVLVEQAEAHLTRLHDGLAAAALSDRDAEALRLRAKVAYQGALSAWSGCAEAQEGLQTLLEETVRRDLAEGDLGAARRALAELPRPRPELEAEVEAAALFAFADEQELAEAREARAAHDAQRGERSRRIWLVVMVILGLLGPIRIGAMRMLGRLPAEQIPAPRALAPFVVAALLEWTVRRFRTDRPGAAFNRKMLGLAQIGLCAVGATWTLGLVQGTPVAEIVLHNCVALSALFGLSTAQLDRRFAWLTLGCAVATVCVWRFPAAAELVFGVAMLGSLLAVEPLWRRGVSAGRGPSSAA